MFHNLHLREVINQRIHQLVNRVPVSLPIVLGCCQCDTILLEYLADRIVRGARFDEHGGIAEGLRNAHPLRLALDRFRHVCR